MIEEEWILVCPYCDKVCSFDHECEFPPMRWWEWAFGCSLFLFATVGFWGVVAVLFWWANR
jgi:hypothetical protein